MVKKEKKEKVTIKELPAKVTIIRQISEEERKESSRSSGLEQREEEVERELSSTESVQHFSQGNNFIPSQSVPQTATGNTTVQQRPQEDSEAVKRWYVQSTRLTPGRDEEKYRLPFKQELGQASRDPMSRRNIGGNQELMNLSGSSDTNDDDYELVKPEKKDTRKRYPWEA